MRTTVTLDEDVERMLQDEMRRTHAPFKQCLNEVLRLGFRARLYPPVEPPRFEVKAWSWGLRPEYEGRNMNHLDAELEDEMWIERMRRHEAELEKKEKAMKRKAAHK